MYGQNPSMVMLNFGVFSFKSLIKSLCMRISRYNDVFLLVPWHNCHIGVPLCNDCIRQNTNLILSWVLCFLWLVFLFMMILVNFNIPVRTPKWPPHSLFFRGISHKWLRICGGQLRTSGSCWVFLLLAICFCQNQDNNESETNL